MRLVGQIQEGYNFASSKNYEFHKNRSSRGRGRTAHVGQFARLVGSPEVFVALAAPARRPMSKR